MRPETETTLDATGLESVEGVALTHTPEAGAPLLSIEHVSVVFGRRRGPFPRDGFVAVDDVSLDIGPGETVGVVGESGSGKSTLARAAARLGPVTSGLIRFDGRDVTGLGGGALRRARREFQMIFQNPSTSLNPGMSAGDAVAEPLLVHGLVERRRDALTKAHDLLARCGLPEDSWQRTPRNLSGGQQQRVAIARALSVEPRLIIADEPTSALDVSAQARVINLMTTLQRELHIAYLFISHDLAVVRHVSQRMAVMHRGRVVESGSTDAVCEDPQERYTKELLAASPSVDPGVERQRRAARRSVGSAESA
ncbi:MAG: dipeptide/oligopeptide/nickel ABC transporter ATP-binding protein [Nocardioides sp.]